MIQWTTLERAQEVETAIKANTRPGMPADAVRAFAEAQGMEVSPLRDGTIYASAPAPGDHPLLKAKWLVQFRFDDRHALRETTVKEGLIGL